MLSYIILEQQRTPIAGDLIQIKFFPFHIGGRVFTIDALTPDEAFSLARKSPFTRNRLFALQEKTSYDLAVRTLAAGYRANGLLRGPASSGA